ncbi:hypothetical protein ABFX02_04G088000 [Erythranthe guttata]
MAQLERPKRSYESPKTPRSHTSPTFEQLLRVDEAFWSPTTTSPAPGMNHDQEGYLSPTHNKKSVLTKVKEKAKKLRYSLSGRRKHENEQGDDNNTPPWGVSLEDDSDEDYEIDDDPEYLGAPMYESEAAPEILKETARQHPRAVPVVSESHRVPNMNKHEHEEKKPVSPPNTTLSEKLVPAYTAMSDATHKIASRIAGLTIATPDAQKTTGVHVLSHDEMIENLNSGSLKQYNAATTSPQTWDKGVSVKEYFMNKLEPGEDERALSQAITEAISPRKSTSGDTGGVVEKVKDAVTSFFRHEEENPSDSVVKPASLSSSNNPSHIPYSRSTSQTVSRSSKAFHPSTSKANSTPVTPLSYRPRDVLDEENHGKVLQSN